MESKDVFFPLPLWLLDIWLAEKVQNWAVRYNWWCANCHCSCWRAASSWKQFSSVFSKTNDDKRFHLNKLPSSNHSLQEPLVNQFVGVKVGFEQRWGRFWFSQSFARCYWLWAAEFLLKIQEITRLHFCLPHFVTLPDLQEKSEVSMAIGKALVPGNRNVQGLMTNPGAGGSCHWPRCFVCGGLPKGIHQQWLKELSRPLSVPHTNETLPSRTVRTPPLQNATLFNPRFNPNQGKASFPPWNFVLHHGEVT